MAGHLENPLTFVRSIKGAPSSILWALFFTRRAMEAQELERWCNYGNEKITAGLRLLCDLGWVVAHSSRGPWALAEGRQLPLVNFFDNAESDLNGLGDPIIIINGKDNLPILPGNNNKGLSPIKSDSPEKNEPPARQNPYYLENVKACKKAGILPPTREKIADQMDDEGKPITPQFILDHVEAAGPGNLGRAIIRIQDNQPVPYQDAEESQRDKLVRKLRSSGFMAEEEEIEDDNATG